jgi:hypothetical protein
MLLQFSQISHILKRELIQIILQLIFYPALCVRVYPLFKYADLINLIEGCLRDE